MPPRPWTVEKHQPLVKLEDNLWTVEADLPSKPGKPPNPMKRRMCIARLDDGRLVFMNGIALDEPSMKQLKAWGTPAFLLVPNAFHRLDIHAWKLRYPQLKLLCGGDARAKVAERAVVDGSWELAPRDAGFRVESVEGGKMGEAVGISQRGGRTTLVFFGDTIINAYDVPGFTGLIFKLLGFTGAPHVPRLLKLIGTRDKRALRAHLARLAAMPGLARLVTSHGPVVTQDVAGAMQAAVRQL